MVEEKKTNIEKEMKKNAKPVTEKVVGGISDKKKDQAVKTVENA